MADRAIGIVGAGVVGVAIAYSLQRRGMPCFLVDQTSPGLGASFGNMASIAITEFLPASRPSVWKQMPGWLLDRDGPVRVRAPYLPRLLPWMIRFLAASKPSRVREIEAAGAALCRRVHDDLLPLLADAGLSDYLSEHGCLGLYKDEAELAADREHIEALERFGFEHRHLDAQALRALEPALSPEIGRGILFPQNLTVRDPYRLVVALFDAYRAMGGGFIEGKVAGFDRSAGRVTAVRLADGRALAASDVVLCAGAHSGRLARELGDHIPLETERGYHGQIASPGIGLRHSLIWPARAFMVSPTAAGIRVGGTVEMAGLDAAPDFRRADILLKRAREALPALQTDGASKWMGHRPALPDTLPVIGPSPVTKGAWYATGHGHLGLTHAATTARLIADLLTDRIPPIDMAPYRAGRF